MQLRYAYNTNGAANHRLTDAISLIAEAGYDGIAITLDHHHLDPFADDWIAQTKAVGRLLQKRGLGCVIETGARYLLDPREKHEPTLLSPEVEGRARRVAFLTRALEIGSELGAECMSFWAGVPKDGVDREAARHWLLGGLESVVAAAERIGIDAALEPEPGMLIETVYDYEILRNGLPGLKLALDTGHCLVTGDVEPDEAVIAHADHLGTVAIEDMKRGEHVHLPFGEGDMDVPAILTALKKIGFGRLICVELSRESPRAHDAIPESLAYLRAAEADL
ncbi:MAG: sugar phosphate isomerase/epimerase family protein [Pacificimonas sp.]